MNPATSTQRSSSSGNIPEKASPQTTNGASPQPIRRNKEECRKVYELLAAQVRDKFQFKEGTSVATVCKTVNAAISSGATFMAEKGGKKYILVRLEKHSEPGQIGTRIGEVAMLRSGGSNNPCRGSSPMKLYLL